MVTLVEIFRNKLKILLLVRRVHYPKRGRVTQGNLIHRVRRSNFINKMFIEKNLLSD